MLSRQHLMAAGAGALTVAALGTAAFSFAQTGTAAPGVMPQHGVAGTVTAINGDTITLSGKNGSAYTINASSATITKDTAIGVSDIKVGDIIAAQGRLSGTALSATAVHDGSPMGLGWAYHGFGHPHYSHGDADDAVSTSAATRTSGK